MNQHQALLKRITGILLTPDDDYRELKQATEDLFQLFISISDFEPDSDSNREDVYLEQGKAIGPVWAALCIKEIMRTKRFIRGLYLGIRSAQERFPGQRIHILYAGTGPFATLALPLTTVFTSEEIEFTMLEINQLSLETLRKVVQTLEVERYISQIVRCDATTYQLDPAKPVHILITETMQNALQKEPHVGITLNLAPQITVGGILIPENIAIEAALLDSKKNVERMMGNISPDEKCYYPLGKIFELNQQTVEMYAASGLAGGNAFPEVEVTVPSGVSPTYNQLCLLTTIQTYGGEVLTHWQSSLNLPKMLQALDRAGEDSAKIIFQYELTGKPGFSYKML